MPKIFDESIFRDGLIFDGVNIIGVNNDVDMFLVKRLNKTPTYICGDAPIVLNPVTPCRSYNIYTMKPEKADEIRETAYNQPIIVSSIFSSKNNIKIEEFRDEFTNSNYIIDIPDGSLNPSLLASPFTIAILVKFYAVNGQIKITRRLYELIKGEFDKTRKWFLTEDK